MREPSQRGTNSRKGFETPIRHQHQKHPGRVSEALIPGRGLKPMKAMDLLRARLIVSEALIPGRGLKPRCASESEMREPMSQRGTNSRKGFETPCRCAQRRGWPCQRGTNSRKGFETRRRRRRRDGYQCQRGTNSRKGFETRTLAIFWVDGPSQRGTNSRKGFETGHGVSHCVFVCIRQRGTNSRKGFETQKDDVVAYVVAVGSARH